MRRDAVGLTLAVWVTTAAAALSVGVPAASAEDGDTHVTGQGVVQTLECNASTLHVNGTGNHISALGTCWAVTLQGNSHVVTADSVVNDITVYGRDQTVLYHDGDPNLRDPGREPGMTNRLDRVPA